MSNSIWHDRYIELPEDVFANSVRPCVIAVDENKKIIGACYGLRGSIPEIKYWARVDDLIAQADKAERLQKALCFIRNIRGAGMSYQDMFLDAHEVAKTALDPEHKPVLCGRYDEETLDEIKQLTKGDK